MQFLLPQMQLTPYTAPFPIAERRSPVSSALLNIIAVVHILTCILLIGLVLLQDPKGGAAGGIFGGGSNSLLGATGATTFLAKFTRFTAIGFATLCLLMVYMLTKNTGSILDRVELPAGAVTAPASSGETVGETAPDAPAAGTTPAPSESPANTK